MIDVKTEDVLTFFQASKQLATKPTYRQLYNWAHTGLLHHGTRIKLEWVKIGGQPCTSTEAFERFVQRTNAPLEDT